MYFLTDSIYLSNQTTTNFSQYEKTALQNNIRRKEDQVQALRYGNAMRCAVSANMMYRIYENVSLHEIRITL